MPSMIRPYQDGKLALRVLLTSVFVLVLIGYSLFQVHKMLTGPVIEISSLPEYSLVSGNSKIAIKGKAENVAFISLNDNPIFIDEEGIFKEDLLLYPGYNIIKLYGKDKFGKSLTRLVEVTYQP